MSVFHFNLNRINKKIRQVVGVKENLRKGLIVLKKLFMILCLFTLVLCVGCGGGGGGGSTPVLTKTNVFDTLQFRSYVAADPLPGYTQTVAVTDVDGNPLLDGNGNPVTNTVVVPPLEIKVSSPLRLDAINNRADYLASIAVMQTMSVELGLMGVTQNTATMVWNPNELLMMTHEVVVGDKLLSQLWAGWSWDTKKRFLAAHYDAIPTDHPNYIDWTKCSEVDCELQFNQMISGQKSNITKTNMVIQQIRLEGLLLR